MFYVLIREKGKFIVTFCNSVHLCLIIFKYLYMWALYLWLSVQHVPYINVFVESNDKKYFFLNTDTLTTVARLISVLSDVKLLRIDQTMDKFLLLWSQQEQREHTIWRRASDCLCFLRLMNKCLVFSILAGEDSLDFMIYAPINIFKFYMKWQLGMALWRRI